jgi:hypothetical protein
MNELIVLPPPKPRKDRQGAPELGAPERFPRLEAASSPRWKRFAGAVAALALAGGIGWATAARFDDSARGASPELTTARNAAELAARSAAAATAALEAQRQNTEQEIAVLRDHVEGLKSKLEAQAQKTHAAETTIAALQKSLSEQRAEAAATTSQLQAKLEKVQTLAAERTTDRAPVSSIGKPLPKPLPAARPLPLPVAAAAAPRTPPTAYRAFVLRDIEDGHAVVEGADGLEEVGPGDVLPGGARVERIEKRGPNWVVLTNRGAILPDGRWDD